MGSSASKQRRIKNSKANNPDVDAMEDPDGYWTLRQKTGNIDSPLAHLIEECVIRGKNDVLEWYCFNEIYETEYWTRQEFYDAILNDKLSYSATNGIIQLARRVGKVSALKILGMHSIMYIIIIIHA